ncbi:MAG TPA: folylpolyglutamate synthase/dihydrofolate synthase family protein [Mycobacteriales bacterium]|nr:folylpolyglutamate synthase/dihydrofolate synthase family protein [Mycobacteriales bacterium]
MSEELERVEAELRERWPESKLDPSLDRIAALVDILGQPQRAYPVIHITGTNGKTTTARMIESLLHSFGLRVGRVTSPHLISPTERIVVDGEPISGERFAEIYDDIAPYLPMVDDASEHPLSYFEVVTAMAFVAFADTPVDIAVIEVGMGGRWDATNVADGQIAVLTPIALDHTDYLGDTIEKIAQEKAGIIKPGATAILARQENEAANVLIRAAVEADAAVAREGLEFGVLDRKPAVDGQLLSLQGLGGQYDEVFLPLYGAHQAQNAALALAAVEAFFGAGASKHIDADLVRAGFAEVRSPGRLEVVRTAPTVLIDAAHNPHGMRATVAAVTEAFSFSRLIGVVAALGDKDVRGILEALEPALESIVVTENSSPRSLHAQTLGDLAEDVFGEERVLVHPSLPDALEAAITLVDESVGTIGSAGVLVTGSVVTAGDARILLRTSDE